MPTQSLHNTHVILTILAPAPLLHPAHQAPGDPGVVFAVAPDRDVELDVRHRAAGRDVEVVQVAGEQDGEIFKVGGGRGVVVFGQWDLGVGWEVCFDVGDGVDEETEVLEGGVDACDGASHDHDVADAVEGGVGGLHVQLDAAGGWLDQVDGKHEWCAAFAFCVVAQEVYGLVEVGVCGAKPANGRSITVEAHGTYLTELFWSVVSL